MVMTLARLTLPPTDSSASLTAIPSLSCTSQSSVGCTGPVAEAVGVGAGW